MQFMFHCIFIIRNILLPGPCTWFCNLNYTVLLMTKHCGYTILSSMLCQVSRLYAANRMELWPVLGLPIFKTELICAVTLHRMVNGSYEPKFPKYSKIFLYLTYQLYFFSFHCSSGNFCFTIKNTFTVTSVMVERCDLFAQQGAHHCAHLQLNTQSRYSVHRNSRVT